MQSIEAIRRTNELSKVLQRHGFATDSFEAAVQANKMTGDQGSVVLNEVADRQRPTTATFSPQVERKIEALERSKHLLSGRVDQLGAELVSTQEALKAALQRLDSAEQKIRAFRNQAPAQSTPAAAPCPPTQATEPVPRPTAQQASPQQNRHPRQAAMDPKYSIENVFYCGSGGKR